MTTEAAAAAYADRLRIRVLADSQESGLFVFRVRCPDPRLLDFWRRKPAFANGQVEQTAVWPHAPPDADADAGAAGGGGGGGGLDFVLRVVNRTPGVPNADYWAPFLLALCLDARALRFRLPESAASSRDIRRILAERGELVLIRRER